MKYFLPFWPGDDVYPRFNPWKDTWDSDDKQLRIWEVFPKPPIDGVLVSLVNINGTKFLREEANAKGIKEALGFYGPIMGDCGAYSYVNERNTPNPIETLKVYKKLGFDLCVTVDHLVVNTIKVSKDKSRKLTEDEKYDRWELTLKNAEKMFEEVKKGEYDGISLIGVTQGMGPDTYTEGVRRLLECGFDYIGLGGLVRRTTKFIERVLTEVGSEIKRELRNRNFKKGFSPRIGVHLFGIARENLFDKMVESGVTSFDSASPLRKAWTSSIGNYMLNRTLYTAIRIPYPRDDEEILFNKVWENLRRFEEGSLNSDELIENLKSYAPQKITSRENEIKKTLLEKPWEKCDCPLCKEIGLHICIFRGCERNMRRGFHNVYHFYNLVRETVPRILALTNCSKKKDPEANLLPAYKRYMPSSPFKTFWKNVYDLPVEVGVLSGKYMLITWHTLIPDYDDILSTEKIPFAVKDLVNQLEFYDKVFFIGLGAYREAVKQAAEILSVPVEVFPKLELSRGKLDIIEYNRQMHHFREAIEKEIDSYPIFK